MANEFQNEKDGLLKSIAQLERDGHFLNEQIGDLRRNLLAKDEEIAEMERRKQKEIENIRREVEEINQRRLVKNEFKTLIIL